jgi:hypothetical protein
MEQPSGHTLKWDMAAVTSLLNDRKWICTHLADYTRENNNSTFELHKQIGVTHKSAPLDST